MPVAVSGLGVGSGVIAVSAGGNHGLALKSDGTVLAWGNNVAGQLGIGSTIDSVVPVPVSGLGVGSGVIAVSAGRSLHSLALRSDGTVLAWGWNANGQLGTGSPMDSLVPAPVSGLGGQGLLSGVVAVSAGGQHSLALKFDGMVLAWGYNNNGQLGTNNYTSSLVPLQVSGLGVGSGVVAVEAGVHHSLALKSDGALLAWGNNSNGQLGNNSTTDSLVPIQVSGVSGLGVLSGVVVFSAGGSHSLALGTVSACAPTPTATATATPTSMGTVTGTSTTTATATSTPTSTSVATSTPTRPATATSAPTRTATAVPGGWEQRIALHQGWNWMSFAVVPIPPTGEVVQPTQRFHDYWGTVMVDGAPAPVGTVVEAFNGDGVLVGSFTVSTQGYYGYLRVYGNDPTASPPLAGMRDGEAIAFKVNGYTVSGTTPAWRDAYDPTQVDLSLRSAVPVTTVLWSLVGSDGQPLYDYVLGEEGTYSPWTPALNSFSAMVAGNGYFVRMQQAATLVIVGRRLPTNASLDLSVGWHWIGYFADTDQSAPGRALPGVLGALAPGAVARYDFLLGETGTFSPILPSFLNTLGEMSAGRGYIIRMTQGGTLSY